MNWPVDALTVIPPLFVIGIPVNPVIGVTVLGGIDVEPTGIGVGGNPTVPDVIVVAVAGFVIYEID